LKTYFLIDPRILSYKPVYKAIPSLALGYLQKINSENSEHETKNNKVSERKYYSFQWNTQCERKALSHNLLFAIYKEIVCLCRVTGKCSKVSLVRLPINFCAAISEEKKKLALYCGLYGNIDEQ